MEIVIIVVVVAVFLVFAYFSHLHAKQRRLELAAWAAEIGWPFDPEEDYSHDGEYPQFEIFSQGHSRYAYNTLTGTFDVGGQPCAAKMGDYHYQVTTHNDKGSTTHTYTFSYLIVHLPYRQLPELMIRREGMFDAVKRAFGFDDIDFESAEFSQRFFVKSSDKRFAYDVIHPPVMEYLLANELPTIDVSGSCCCLADNSVWSADDFRRTLDCAKRFFDLWPKHLTSTLEPN